ncbi:MAG: hypothetical protein ACOCWQ_05745 [Nanoarchaeota archaeon]
MKPINFKEQYRQGCMRQERAIDAARSTNRVRYARDVEYRGELRQACQVWSMHQARVQELDGNARLHCLNGYNLDRLGLIAPGCGVSLAVEGMNPASQDPVYQALGQARRSIDEVFRQHRLKYVGNSRAHPRAKDHRHVMGQRALDYQRQITQRTMKESLYGMLSSFQEEGNLAESLYRETGRQLNERQQTLMEMDDPHQIALYLLSGQVVPAEEACQEFAGSSAMNPMHAIALFSLPSDRIEFPRCPLERRAALLSVHDRR